MSVFSSPIGSADFDQSAPKTHYFYTTFFHTFNAMSTKIETKEQAQKVLDLYDFFLFDCDGVLWLGDHLLPLVVETLQMLKSLGKTTVFVTNNLTKCREDYVAKFAKMGISDVDKLLVFGLAYATAVYIDKILQLPKDKKVWVLGEKGIEQELAEMGYTTIGGTDPKLSGDYDPDHAQLTCLDDSVGAVVAGLAFNVNYLRLGITLQYLLKDKKLLPFIATNIDSTFPTKGRLMIGAGLIVESVAHASGREPDAVCGKPNLEMMKSIHASFPGVAKNPKRGLMIGDRLNTDMKFGRDGGLDTLLVLTGIETEEGVKAQAAQVAPTYYASKLGDLYELTK